MGTLRGRTRSGRHVDLVQVHRTDGWPTDEGWLAIGLLSLGFVTSSLVTFGLTAAVLGPVAVALVPDRTRLLVLGIVAGLAAVFDLYAAVRRGLSPLGVSRQTPKVLFTGEFTRAWEWRGGDWIQVRHCPHTVSQRRPGWYS